MMEEIKHNKYDFEVDDILYDFRRMDEPRKIEERRNNNNGNLVKEKEIHNLIRLKRK